MHKIPNTSVDNSKTLHKPAIQVWVKNTRRSIGLVSTGKGKFPERPHPSHVSEVPMDLIGWLVMRPPIL
jgi:hypothetical protein